MTNKNKIDWKYDNSYIQLPKDIQSKKMQEKIKKPKIIFINKKKTNEKGKKLSRLNIEKHETDI